MTTGRVFDIQRFSIHDGPGIRTTVFFKGCSLRCLWCHNPESIPTAPSLSFVPDKCIGCGYCVGACPHGAHAMADGRHEIDRDRCQVCGLCTRECFAGALELAGRDVTVTEVIEEVLRDKPFYDNSNGGMTLSGGEPLMQMDFALALLREAKTAGLHCAVDTCGYVNDNGIARVAEMTDLFLYDLKETDPKRHIECTGVSNEPILANLRLLHDAGAAVLVRLPIVPGLNDRADHFAAVAQLAKSLPNLLGFEVKGYHNLGLGKLARFGLDAGDTAAIERPDPATVAGWAATLRELGVPVIG